MISGSRKKRFTAEACCDERKNPCPPQRPMTVAEFDQRIASGLIAEDDPVELLEGVITTKVPKKPSHRDATRRTLNALAKLLPNGGDAFKEDAIVCGDHSKPEPDVSVVRAEVCDDATRDATAGDCCLVVEVAEASLDTERGTKLTIYAKARVPVYWIVNLFDDQIEVYSYPDQDPVTYGIRVAYRRGDHIPVVIVGRVVGTIAVEDLLP
jgi:Uma2 family endonuclease